MRDGLGRSLVSQEVVITRTSAPGVQAGNSSATPAISKMSAAPVSALSLTELSPVTTFGSPLGAQLGASATNVFALAFATGAPFSTLSLFGSAAATATSGTAG
jgi:hypothetical protein